MKKNQIDIGGVYTAKVSDKVVNVRIDSEHRSGGWHATNLKTSKKIHIKTARRLRSKVKEAKAADPAKPKAAGKDKNARKLSALDAAAAVLRKATAPMNCKAMIDAMEEARLWSSPGGKTPSATLYSAILRELASKGDDARFRKVERGHFEFAGKGV